jgi:hypothetical protein
MRKIASVIVVVVVLVAAGAWWLGRAGSADPSDATSTTLATSTSTSTTSTTVRPETTTTLDHPETVCVNRGGVAKKGKATIPIEMCVPWRPVDRWAGKKSSIYTTSLVPHADQPSIRVYAAWIRTSSTDLALYPGYEGPGPSTLARGPEMVPPAADSRLLATFNSGFYEKDGPAGFYSAHTLYYPMIDGLATVVRYSNGKVGIIDWKGGPKPPPSVVMARQNLVLLVDHSRATARSADNALWGVTLGGVAAVWRTALGIDAEGNLFYVAAPEQTSQSLAAIMVQLHAVEAMQLDINPEWPIFATYAAAGAKGPSLFVPNPNQIPGRFLYPSTKDFFAVFISHKRGAAQPW